MCTTRVPRPYRFVRFNFDRLSSVPGRKFRVFGHKTYATVGEITPKRTRNRPTWLETGHSRSIVEKRTLVFRPQRLRGVKRKTVSATVRRKQPTTPLPTCCCPRTAGRSHDSSEWQVSAKTKPKGERMANAGGGEFRASRVGGMSATKNRATPVALTAPSDQVPRDERWTRTRFPRFRVRARVYAFTGTDRKHAHARARASGARTFVRHRSPGRAFENRRSRVSSDRSCRVRKSFIVNVALNVRSNSNRFGFDWSL